MYGNSKTTVNRLYRLYKIHQKISSGSNPKAEELAREIGCGVRTIYEDIKYMSTYEKDPATGKITGLGAPIASFRHGGYYYSSPWRFPLENQMLDLSMLSTAKLLLSHFENTPLYSEVEDLLNKVCKIQSDSPLLNRIALAPTTNTTQPINSEIWKLICDALSNNHVIKFRYLNNDWDPDLKESVLHVEPYQLLIDEGKSLLFGYLQEKKAVRLYNINLMQEIVETRNTFELPENYEFKYHTGKSHFGAFTRYAERKYKIAFYEDAVPDIKLGNWADDQEFVDDVDEEGYERTVVTFSSAQDMRVLDWVFKNKAYAKPLAPESLVTRWKYNVAVMAKMAGFDVEIDYSLLDKAAKLEREGK